jgi:nucleoside-diphosphate-sugar epimerase
MLIEISKGARVRCLVFASSCSVYGDSENLMSERSAVKPISLYAQTKLDSERALLEAKSDSFHPTILRFATVFGNSFRPRFDLAVNLLTAKAHRDGVVTIFNGEQWRPFIHVRDVAEAIVTVLKAPESLVSGEIFNVGDSRLNFTLAQVADRIKQQFPAMKVEHVDNSDRRNYRVSFDKIKNHLGFHAGISLEEGIAEIKTALEGKSIPDYTDVVYHNQRFLQMVGPPLVKDATDSGVMAAFATAITSHDFSPQPS